MVKSLSLNLKYFYLLIFIYLIYFLFDWKKKILKNIKEIIFMKVQNFIFYKCTDPRPFTLDRTYFKIFFIFSDLLFQSSFHKIFLILQIYFNFILTNIRRTSAVQSGHWIRVQVMYPASSSLFGCGTRAGHQA